MAGKSLYSLIFFLGAQTRDFQSGLQRAQSDFTKFNKSMASIGLGLAGVFSVDAILNYSKTALAAYDVQAKAEAGLLKSLSGRIDVQGRLIAQSNQLQQTTLFGDEEIVNAQKQLAVMGLTEQQITKLIPLIADFATVNGMDLDSAAKLVAKSIAGSANALGRYGVTIDSTASKTEKANRIAEVFADRYGGQAATAAQTGASGIQQFTKALGELTETFGGALAKNSQSFFNQLAEGLFATNELLTSDVVPAWKKFLALIDPNQAVLISAAADMAVKAGDQKIKDTWKQISEMRKNAKQLIADEISAIQQRREENAAAAKEAELNRKEADEKNKLYLESISILGRLNAQIKSNEDLMKQATSEQKLSFYRNQNDLLKMQLEYYEKIGTSLEKMKTLGLPSSIKAQTATSVSGQTMQPRNSQMAPMGADEPIGGEGGFSFGITNNYQAELENLKNALDQGSILYEQYYASVQALEQQKNAGILDGVTTMLSDTKGLFEEHTKAYKILASAQALIQTYVNATQAFGALASIPVVGPALGALAAGAAIALGLRNVAKINSVGMATGGIVPSGYPNDSYPARLTSGEMVIPPHSLSSVFGNAMPSSVKLVGVLSGRDIRISNERDQYFKQRTTGR